MMMRMGTEMGTLGGGGGWGDGEGDWDCVGGGFSTLFFIVWFVSVRRHAVPAVLVEAAATAADVELRDAAHFAAALAIRSMF